MSNELIQKNAELGRFLFCERYTLQPVKNSLYIAEGQDLKRGAVVDVNGVLVGTNSLMPYAVLETDCDTRAKGAFASVFVKGEFNFDKLFFADGLSKNDLDNIVYNGSGIGLVIKPYNFSSGFIPKSESTAANFAPEYEEKTYPAYSYVMHYGILYTNPYAIETAESWNPAHWVQTNVANMIAFVPNKTALIGGREYRTTQIGEQIWLAENLDFKFDGCAIEPEGSPETPAAWYYDNDEKTYGIDGTKKCGILYNWYAVKYLNDNKDILCPGWHVPTASEWDALVTAVGGVSTAGTKLKARNNTITSNWPSVWGGTDDYGFCVLPAGVYNGNTFAGINTGCYVWTITESGDTAYRRFFDSSSAIIQSTGNKYQGYSLRLVKDT